MRFCLSLSWKLPWLPTRSTLILLLMVVEPAAVEPAAVEPAVVVPAVVVPAVATEEARTMVVPAVVVPAVATEGARTMGIPLQPLASSLLRAHRPRL